MSSTTILVSASWATSGLKLKHSLSMVQQHPTTLVRRWQTLGTWALLTTVPHSRLSRTPAQKLLVVSASISQMLALEAASVLTVVAVLLVILLAVRSVVGQVQARLASLRNQAIRPHLLHSA